MIATLTVEEAKSLKVEIRRSLGKTSSSAILWKSALLAGSNLLSALLPGWYWAFIDDCLEVLYLDGKLSQVVGDATGLFLLLPFRDSGPAVAQTT